MQTQSAAALRLIKTAGPVSDNGDGSLSVPISLQVSNIGNEALTTIQLEDPLNIFGTGQLLAIENIVSQTLSINPGYDGVADTMLLDTTDDLPVAAAASLTFSLRFAPGDEPGPFLNTATATGFGETTGAPVIVRAIPGGQELKRLGVGENRSRDAAYTVPEDERMHIKSVTFSLANQNPTNIARGIAELRIFAGGPWYGIDTIHALVESNPTSALEIPGVYSLALRPRSDLRISVIASTSNVDAGVRLIFLF